MKVPFITEALRGEVPINFFPAADQDRGVILFGSPGVVAWLSQWTATHSEVRGLYSGLPPYVYTVVARVDEGLSEVWKIDPVAVTASLLGTIGGVTGPVQFINNGFQLMLCDGTMAYVYDTRTATFGPLADPDFPGASALTYQDGYGIFVNPGTGRFYLTKLYDFTDIDALDYASAEASPDDLVNVISDHEELWLCGTKTTEIWYNSGDVFPFTRISGGLIERGTGAKFSWVKLDESLLWLSDARQVIQAIGYQPKVVSTRKMDRELEGYARVDDAIAFGYTMEGHSFYQITFPSANVTWVYDTSTGSWHKRVSYDGSRHLANCYAYLDTDVFFLSSPLHIVGGYKDGIIHRLSMSLVDDNGTEIQRQIDSSEMREEGKLMTFPSLQIEFDGDIARLGRDPVARLQWSRDGGRTFSPEVPVAAGSIADATRQVRRSTWHQLGSDYNRIFRLVVSDPVQWRVIGVSWLK